MYDSIQNLPITRFQSYNLYLLVDAGVGSDLESFDKKMLNVQRLIKSDPKAASLEISNIQQNVRFIMNKTNPKMNSFVCMIKSIDGKLIDDDDLTDDGIKAIIKSLGKKATTYTRMTNYLNSVKKKLDQEFDIFFPSLVSNSKTRSFYNRLKSRTVLILRQIQDPKADFAEKIEAIDNFLLASMKPKNFFGSKGLEVTMIKGFENTCTILEQNGFSKNPRSLTVLSFYQKLEIAKEQMKKSK